MSATLVVLEARMPDRIIGGIVTFDLFFARTADRPFGEKQINGLNDRLDALECVNATVGCGDNLLVEFAIDGGTESLCGLLKTAEALLDGLEGISVAGVRYGRLINDVLVAAVRLLDDDGHTVH